MATAALSKAGKPIVSLKQFRRDMRALGYTVRTRTNSTFIAALVIDSNGVAINAGNVLTAEHIAQHKAFYDYKELHSVRDDDWVVTF